MSDLVTVVHEVEGIVTDAAAQSLLKEDWENSGESSLITDRSLHGEGKQRAGPHDKDEKAKKGRFEDEQFGRE